MDDPFYKASKTLLARTDVTAAEKLVRIVRAHWLAFEGREPTAAEAARATGLGDRTVRRFLAAKLATAKTAKMPAKMAGKTAKLATPNVVKTSVRDVDKGERGTAPPSPGASGQTAKPRSRVPTGRDTLRGGGDGAMAMLHLKAREGGGKWTLARWIGQVEEDEAARRYARADLEAFVAGRTAITEAPWKLAEAVRRHAQAAKQAAFRERLRTIRADGLTRAKGPGGPGRVVYVDPEIPILVIERQIPPPKGTTYGPQVKRWDVTTPEDLAGWRFKADQPRLFQ